MIIRNCHRKLS